MTKSRFSFKGLLHRTVVLFNSLPALVVVFFMVSVIGMNLLANKSINTGLDFLALDCGIILSWGAFLSMDLITRRFGPTASITVSVVALLINLLASFIFLIAAYIPGVWGESFVEGEEVVINTALDNTFKGIWYIILGSSIAFMVSSIVNSILNYLFGKLVKDEKARYSKFAFRSFASTFIGQFVDNIIFALIVSKIFFGWTMVQCLMCALTGAVLELLFEVVFSPIGYHVSKRWEERNIGKEYLELIEEEKRS